MANCPQVDSLITPFVDGEASDAERQEVETHLERCPPCQRQAVAESTARELLRTRSGRLSDSASSELRERCRTARDLAARGSAARGWRRWQRPLAVAAIVLLSVAGAVSWGVVFHPAEAMAAQLTLDHLKCFAVAGRSDGATPAMVSAELKARYGWDVPVPEGPGSEGLVLVAGRRCLVLNGAVAHVLYTRGPVHVSVFVLPATGTLQGRVDILGHTAVMFRRGVQTVVVLSRDDPSNVQLLARSFGNRSQ